MPFPPICLSLSLPRLFRAQRRARIRASNLARFPRNAAPRDEEETEDRESGGRSQGGDLRSGAFPPAFRKVGEEEGEEEETPRLREVIFAGRGKKKDSRKLGEPRDPCECQQTFALRYARFRSASTTRRLRPRDAVRNDEMEDDRDTYAENGRGERDTTVQDGAVSFSFFSFRR